MGCLRQERVLCRDAPAGRFSLQLWRQHVLANLPMYSMLLLLYLDLAHSRVSNRCEETLVDLKRVSRQICSPQTPAHRPNMPRQDVCSRVSTAHGHHATMTADP